MKYDEDEGSGGMGSNMDSNDIFQMFFGGRYGRHGWKQL
jgi:hypothetical protein